MRNLGMRGGRGSGSIVLMGQSVRVGFVCSLMFLSVLVAVAWGQDAPPELAFAKKLYDDGLYLLAAEQYRNFTLENPTSHLVAQAQFMVGESFFAQGDLTQAKEAYGQFLAKYPQSRFASQAWFRLGNCLISSDHFSDAASAFSRSYRAEPDGPWVSQALFGMADALRRAGEMGRALKEFDFFVERFPQSPQVYAAHIARGEILFHLGLLDQARTAYQAAAQKATSPEDLAKARFREVKILALQGQEKGTMDLLSLLIGEGQGSVYLDSALSLLGGIHLDRGEYSQAAEVYRNLASREGADELSEWAGFRQAESLRLAADHERAVSAYRRWLTLYPQGQMAPEAKLGLSRSLRALGDPDSAVIVLEQLTREDEEAEWNSQSWNELATSLYDMGALERALAAYREFLRRYPQSLQADSLYFRTAQILERDLNRPQAALRVYQALSSLYPQSPFVDDADFAVGRCHETSGENGQALQVYRVFVQEHPLSPLYPEAQEKVVYLSTYRVLDERSTLELLVNIHDQLVSGSVEKENVDLRLGEIYFRHLKDFPKAAATLKRYVHKYPESPLADQALFQLVECYRTQAEMLRLEGNKREAAEAQNASVEACRQLLRDYPQSAWADQCALRIIADLLRNSTSQSEELWLDQLDLYSSFVNTYQESQWQASAYLRIGQACMGLAAQDQWTLAKADSVYGIVLSRHFHSPWADTAAFQRIAIAQRQGNEVVVLDQCESFLEQFPQSGLQSQVLFIQAQIQAQRQEHRLAAQLFQSVAKSFPYHFLTEEACLRWAESLWAAGDTQGATRVLEEFGERYPESPLRIRALVLLARDSAQRGNRREAQDLLSSLEHAISIEDRDDRLRLALGDLYLTVGASHKALDSYGSLVRDFPTSNLVVEALEKIAQVHFSNENFVEAQMHYERALEIITDEARRPDLESKRIICLYRLAYFPEARAARKEFEKAHVERVDLVAKLLVEEGQAYRRQGEKSAARESFQAVINHHKNSQYAGEAEYYLGLMALQSSEFTEAADRFQSLMKNHPQSPWGDKALFKMGSALYGLERYDQAAEHYERVADQASEDTLVIDALFNAGICRGKMNDWDGASAAYEDLLRKFPNHPERQKWSLRLGFAYLQADRTGEALRTFEQIDVSNDAELGAEVQFWLSESYFHSGEYEKAAQEYLRVAYLYPHESQWAATAEYNAALSYEKLGRMEEARSLYQKLVASRGLSDQWGALAQERLDRLGD
ncbi:MAG: hypothetical protein AMJ92_05555 [candidate division Zixibacteria bacterium SM23_81]|nr:MAG: hypothetical protein AMJ92_05555 [candidate division Zixibacteria bacterium SM23_81]